MNKKFFAAMSVAIAAAAFAAPFEAAAIIYYNGSGLNGLTANGAQTQGASLQGTDRQGINLQGVNMQGAHMQGIDAQGTTIQGVKIQGQDFQGRNTQGVTAQGTFLNGHPRDALTRTSATVRGVDQDGPTNVRAVGSALPPSPEIGFDSKAVRIEGIRFPEAR